MKQRNKSLLFFIILLLHFNVCLSSSTIDYSKLCKIWGYLKYHEPIIGGGECNWDSILISTLEKIDQGYSIESASFELFSFIDVPKNLSTHSCEYSNSLQYDLYPFWNRDSSYIDKNSLKSLREIQCSFKSFDNKYYGLDASSGVPVFHENSYSERGFPDKNYRMLSLFRFWNVIEYFYPYKHLISRNWDDVLLDYVDVFASADTEIKYFLALRKIGSLLNDAHVTVHMPIDQKWYGKYFSNYFIQYQSGVFLFDEYNSYLPHDDLFKVGDVFLEYNGIKISIIADSLKKYYGASSIENSYRRIALMLTRGHDSLRKVKILRQDSILEYSVKMYSIDSFIDEPREDTASKTKLFNEVYYVNLKNVYYSEVDSIMNIAKGYPAIILDNRFGSNSVSYKIAMCLGFDNNVFCNVILPDTLCPSSFYKLPLSIPTDSLYDKWKGNLYVLSNGYTMSHGEFSNMIYQSYDNCKIIGTPSSGCDGNKVRLDLPGGGYIYFSGIGIEYPDGRQTQGIGITPDIVVHQNIHMLQNGLDNVLQTAIIHAKRDLEE